MDDRNFEEKPPELSKREKKLARRLRREQNNDNVLDEYAEDLREMGVRNGRPRNGRRRRAG